MNAQKPNSRFLEPVDLEIRITTPWGSQGQRFDFVLNSPLEGVGFHQKSIRGREVRSPEEFQRKLLRQLESLSSGFDVDRGPVLRAEVVDELTTIGRDLYEELFPAELRSIYRTVRDRVRTLLVTTDEPWIPWEILRPSDQDDDDFLCMRHQMSRWLTGEVPLAADRQLRRLLYLDYGEAEDLAEKDQEREHFEAFANSIPGVEASVHSKAGFSEVARRLEEESFDLLHFAGHGQHDSQQPGEAKILLGERPFRARHLSPGAEKKLRRERPVIFFNGCQLGQLDRSLTELDGWAHRWVRRCGCSAFLAPAWSLRDSSARRFAELFYDNLLAGQPLGAAVHRARHALRQERPGDSAWLAYQLYGSPNARYLFGDQAAFPANLPEVTAAAPPSSSPAPPTIQQRHTKPHGIPVRPARVPSATARSIGLSQPPEIHGQPRPDWYKNRTLRTVAAVGLVAILGWTVSELRTTPDDADQQQPISETTPDDSSPAEPSPTEAGEGENPKKIGAGTPPLKLVETPPPSPPPPSKPKSTLPFLPVVPGKVAIVAFNSSSQKPDPDIAQAIRSALLEVAGAGSFEIPQLDAAMSQQFANGSRPSQSTNNETPWGAEYLLIANGASEALPQSASRIRSVALTLSSELIRANDGTTVSHGQGTHTGTGITPSGALVQAATRCLKPISAQLNQGADS